MQIQYGSKGVGRKFSTGGQRKKTENKQKLPKIALFSLFQGGGRANGKKRPKNCKKCRKIAFLSFYLPYLYHVGKSKRGRPPLPPAADVHVRKSLKNPSGSLYIVQLPTQWTEIAVYAILKTVVSHQQWLSHFRPPLSGRTVCIMHTFTVIIIVYETGYVFVNSHYQRIQCRRSWGCIRISSKNFLSKIG